MRYLSVCSGIEAATVAWHPLGWSPVAFAEVDAFPSAVLRHHYPSVPNLGDMTKFQDWPDADVDVLVGGTPCQSFSVAGLRKGLADPRGSLLLTYLAIADRYRPDWLVWENVPGVLSADDGRAFGSLLGGLAELGYGFAYRVLDAQYFNLAQRRARVFVVGRLGDWRRAAAVLFERESLSGHPAPRREAGQAAPTVPSCRSAGGGLGTDFDCDGGLIAGTVSSKWAKGTGGPAGDECYNLTVAHAFDARQSDVIQYGDQAGPLDTDGHSIAVAFSAKDYGADAGDIAPTLRAGGHTSSHANGGVMPAVAVRTAQTGANGHGVSDVAHTLDRATGQAVATPMAVRRLTPRECSRLQGFPDDYLELKYANAEEAHAAQILHELWREVGAQAAQKQGWRAGISAALLTPEILLSGVFCGWISWEMAADCADARGALPGEKHHHEGFVRALRLAAQSRCSPYRRESFEQCSRELGSDLSVVPHEGASARALLRSSRLWASAQAKWPLRYAFAAGEAGRSTDKLNPDGPRYKALGNSMAVTVMAWIGRRIQMVEDLGLGGSDV